MLKITILATTFTLFPLLIPSNALANPNIPNIIQQVLRLNPQPTIVQPIRINTQPAIVQPVLRLNPQSTIAQPIVQLNSQPTFPVNPLSTISKPVLPSSKPQSLSLQAIQLINPKPTTQSTTVQTTLPPNPQPIESRPIDFTLFPVSSFISSPSGF